MPATRKATVIGIASLAILVLSALLLAVLGTPIFFLLQGQAQITCASSASITVPPLYRVIYLSVMAVLTLAGFLVRRKASTMGSKMSVVASTVSLVLMLVNILLYAAIDLGVFNR
ncbi:hypothetical protein [Xanthomonas medicagonis]|uniref:hypothetical protein n=1 Tax=Xanthomonas medicagonis TaxID=3160841 RepID=UPI00351555F3